MYEVDMKAMPGNEAGQRLGGRAGKWYVYSRDLGSGHVINRNTPINIHAENLDYDEAFELMHKIDAQLNPK